MSEPFPPEFERFVAPARRRPEAWRLGAGLAFIFFAVLGVAITFGGAITSLIGEPTYVERVAHCNATDDFNACMAAPESADRAVTEGSSAYALAMLFFFATLLAALWLMLPRLHGRGLRSVFGPGGRAVPQFLACLRPLLLVTAVIYLAPPYADYGELTLNMKLGTWLALLPLGLAAVLVQVSAEEAVFRGYILQQMAARSSARLAWFVLPAAIFGALHYDPDIYGQGAWMIAAWAVLFGLATADLTYRAGSLGPAIALHFVNNCMAILVFSFDGTMSGLALYASSTSIAALVVDPVTLAIEALVLLIGWLTCRIALRR